MKGQNYYTTLEGGHKTVSKTAVVLVNAGQRVAIANGNTTSTIGGSDKQYEASSHEGHTAIIDSESMYVQATISDDSKVTVRHE